MANRTVLAWLLVMLAAICPAQEKSLNHALNQKVTAHFHEVSVSAAMQFLSMHGIDVVARTSDINLNEKLALDVTSATMRDFMKAIAVALGARWTRFGHIFVLCRADEGAGAAAYVTDFRKADGSTLDDIQDAPSAVVSVEGPTAVHPGSLATSRDTYTVRLSSDGEWRVTNSTHTVVKRPASALRPKLSIRQRRLLRLRGYLRLSNLTAKQTESLGQAWPDGNYHARSGSRTLVIRP